MTDIDNAINKKNFELVISTLKESYAHGLKISISSAIKTADNEHISLYIDDGFLVVIKVPSFKESLRLEIETETTIMVERIIDKFDNILPRSIDECKELIKRKIYRKKRRMKEYMIIAAGGPDAVERFFENLIAFVEDY